MDEYTLRDMREDDIPPILAIAEKELGKHYIQKSTLIDEQNIVLCAEMQGRLVGFCTGKIIPSKTLSSTFRKAGRYKIPELDHFTEIGWTGSIAVSREYGRRGIGTALMRACLERLLNRGAAFFMMTAWKSKNGIHLGSIAEKQGFRNRCEIEEFWKEDSLKHQYSCTVCHSPPCCCTAVIYTRK
jgi:ribosomal protein S18 acetylase RimI-like enzyme